MSHRLTRDSEKLTELNLDNVDLLLKLLPTLGGGLK